MNAITRITARRLTAPEAKALQGHALGAMAAIETAERKTSNTILICSVGFFTMGALLCGGAIALKPYELRHVENHYIAVDTVHGYIVEMAGPEDAPRLFNQATDEAAIKKYIEAYYTYEPHTDQTRYTLVQLMSSAEQAGRYIKWHDTDPAAPRQQPTKERVTWDVNDHMVMLRKAVDKDDTRRYTVQFQLRENRKDIIGPWQTHSADIAFQWHPKVVKDVDAQRDNLGGFVAIMMSEM